MGRVNTLLPAPANPLYKLVHVGFTSPGGDAFNTDKDKYGFRYDSIGIANGVTNAGKGWTQLLFANLLATALLCSK
jgi:hypothetical protein